MHISPNDHRHYRHITLANNLRLLLVEDHQAPRSAAALTVCIGHFSDPDDREGLAHFLEHMLFLGTKEYPTIGEFQTFINRHGGSNNAWTGTENTTYFFDIQHEYFEEGLSRFGQFFTTPLFNEEAVTKERNAVDSEYRMKIQDDVRRIYQVQKETINPAHPFSKFSVGNTDTLADRKNHPVRDDLIHFYRTYYSANLMTAAIIAPFSLDTLEAYATAFFGQIPNVDLDPPCIDVPFTTTKEKQKFICIEPLKDIKKLTLTFSLPNSERYYKKKPLSYIAHLLGDEGKGSLMALLKQKGLINSLAAGGGLSGSNFRQFSISVSLTDAGLNKLEEIVTDIFMAIALIKHEGLAEWRYLEKRSVQELAFQYQEPARPIDYVSHLVLNLQHYEPEDVIYGDFKMEAFDQALIEDMLAALSPENLRLILVAKGQTYDKIAKWYDTPYSIQTVSPKQIKAWHETTPNKALCLPQKNPFITDDHPIHTPKTTKQRLPACIESSDGFTSWLMQDTIFRSPKGVLYIAIDSPNSVADIESIVKTRVSVEMLVEAINEVAYPAEIAGMSYNFYTNQGGATLKLSGLTNTLPILLNVILEKFATRDFDPERFDIIKTQLLRNWKNASQNTPIHRLHNLLSGILQPNNPPHDALIPALETLTVDDLPSFVMKVLSEIHIDMYFHGNWAMSQVNEISGLLKKALRIKEQNFYESTRPLVKIAHAGSLVYQHNFDCDDSAVIVYFQSENTEPESAALFNFAQQLMSATFFHELRTKQQLGYMVGANNMPMNRHPGIIFYVQSPLAGPAELLNAIDEFLNDFFLFLLALTEEEWQMSKDGFLSKLQEPDANLYKRAQRFWISIGNKDHQFSQREKVIEVVENMERADMVRFVVERLKPRTADRLVMYSCGNQHLDKIDKYCMREITGIKSFQTTYLTSDIDNTEV